MSGFTRQPSSPPPPVARARGRSHPIHQGTSRDPTPSHDPRVPPCPRPPLPMDLKSLLPAPPPWRCTRDSPCDRMQIPGVLAAQQLFGGLANSDQHLVLAAQGDSPRRGRDRVMHFDPAAVSEDAVQPLGDLIDVLDWSRAWFSVRLGRYKAAIGVRCSLSVIRCRGPGVVLPLGKRCNGIPPEGDRSHQAGKSASRRVATCPRKASTISVSDADQTTPSGT